MQTSGPMLRTIFRCHFPALLENDENVTIRYFVCGRNESNNKLQ